MIWPSVEYYMENRAYERQFVSGLIHATRLPSRYSEISEAYGMLLPKVCTCSPEEVNSKIPARWHFSKDHKRDSHDRLPSPSSFGIGDHIQFVLGLGMILSSIKRQACHVSKGAGGRPPLQ